MIATLERLAHRRRAPVFAFHTASFMSEAIALYERLGTGGQPSTTRT